MSLSEACVLALGGACGGLLRCAADRACARGEAHAVDPKLAPAASIPTEGLSQGAWRSEFARMGLVEAERDRIEAACVARPSVDAAAFLSCCEAAGLKEKCVRSQALVAQAAAGRAAAPSASVSPGAAGGEEGGLAAGDNGLSALLAAFEGPAGRDLNGGGVIGRN